MHLDHGKRSIGWRLRSGLRSAASSGRLASGTRTRSAGSSTWRGLAAALPKPEVITTDQYAAALAETEDVRAALRTAVEDHRAAEARFERLKEAKTQAEVQAAIVPEDEAERFEVLLAEAADAIGDLRSFVRDVGRIPLFGPPRVRAGGD